MGRSRWLRWLRDRGRLRDSGGRSVGAGAFVGADPGHGPDPSGRYTWKNVEGSLAPALVAPPAMYTAPLHTAAWMPWAPTGMSLK